MTTRQSLADRWSLALRPARLLAGGAVLVGALALGASSDADANAGVVDEIECLALTIYFEARGEPDSGKLAVGHVVMNRVQDSRFPDSVCGVVRQGGEEVLHRCQFSWWCDGRSDDPGHPDAWQHSQALARLVYWNYSDDPTGGAMWYHATYVTPHWHEEFVRGPSIGQHIFYRDANAEVQPGPQIARNP